MKKFTETVTALHEAEAGAKSELQKSYQDYFKAKLAKFDAKSPADLNDEQKKEFFNDVKKDWEKGVGIKPEAKEAMEKEKEKAKEKEAEEPSKEVTDLKGDPKDKMKNLTGVKEAEDLEKDMNAAIKGKEIKGSAPKDEEKTGKDVNDEAKDAKVNEAEIKSDGEFKEYAQTVLKKAFKGKYDEEKAGKTIEGILKKANGDYGAAVGMLTSGLSEGNAFVYAARKAKEEGRKEFEFKGKVYKVNEGKMTGSGVRGEYQMDNANNGLRGDGIFISTDRFGSKNTMNIKISMYSGGSDGIEMDMPKNMAALNDKIREAMSSKDANKVDEAGKADKEKYDMIAQIQEEIFTAVTKELEALDKKIGSIVDGIVKKY